MMFCYQTHGLNIKSELYFPELVGHSFKKEDILIYEDQCSLFPKNNFTERIINPMIKVHLTNNLVKLFWQNVEICTISEDKKIIVNPLINIETNLLRLIILGYAIAIILHRKGRLVIHANAINIGGGAVVLLGPSGRGKSTISLALHKKGYNLLSDDILSLKINDNDLPLVFPSFPRIKLWPDVIGNINENPESMPPLHANTDKRAYYLNSFFQSPLPLNSVYLIETDKKMLIKSLKPQDAVMRLINSSYCYPIFDNNEISENLNQCTCVVNNVPVKVLKIRRSFEDLPKLVERIEKDVLRNKNNFN